MWLDFVNLVTFKFYFVKRLFGKVVSRTHFWENYHLRMLWWTTALTTRCLSRLNKIIKLNNVIAQNGLGFPLDGGTFIINGNKILENWFWVYTLPKW